MQRLILLHSNDIHGEVDNLARIATLIAQIHAEHPQISVLYVDAGDSQDRGNPLSKKTHGIAMYRLLHLAGCQAVVVGNKCMRRYGMDIIPKYAHAIQCPILCANLFMSDGSPIPSTQPSVLFEFGDFKLGMIGITTCESRYIEHYQLQSSPVIPIIQKESTHLRKQGAQAIAILSHMGLRIDFELAHHLELDLIIGAHSHALLPYGEQVGDTHIVQAGDLGRYLGRVDMTWTGEHLLISRKFVMPITPDIPMAKSVLKEIEAIVQDDELHFE